MQVLFTRLPKELLRQISSNLPCQSALDLLLVSRYVYLACNDWTVWQAVAAQHLPNLRYPGSLAEPNTTSTQGWKRFAIAAAKAERSAGRWTIKDLREWMLQLAALGHPSIVQSDDPSLDQLYSTTLFNPTSAQTNESHPSVTVESVQKSTLQTWQLAQAAAFTITMRYLSIPAPSQSCSAVDLQSVPWLRTSSFVWDGASKEEQAKYVAVQHTLANRIVGLLCTSLQAARATTATPGHGSACTFELGAPPSTARIPIPRQIRLPFPFASETVQAFGTCHLPVMSDPTFFTNDEWTGCFSLPGQYGQVFDSVGGRFHDGFPRDDIGLSAPPGDFPHGRSFEGVIRFQLIENGGCEYYKLQSNNFYSAGGLHRIRIQVERRTGQLAIHHWHPMVQDLMVTDGIITPFGILSYLNNRSSWLWLWKTDWSAPAQ
jgi:hypothetical protein